MICYKYYSRELSSLSVFHEDLVGDEFLKVKIRQSATTHRRQCIPEYHFKLQKMLS